MRKIPVYLLRPVFWACCIIALTSIFRLLVIAHNWPPTNSDEGTMGMIALHIAYHSQHPLIYYGQSYMGTLQGYIGALLFHLLGPSLFALRLGLVLMFALYLVVMYQLTTLLYSRGLALATLFLLGFAPRDLLYHQVIAIGGHAELPLFGALLLLSACWLALTYQRSAPDSAQRSSLRRLLIYMLWGGVAGIAIWDDYLIMPFIIMSALLLIVVCHAELRIRVLASTFLAIALGALPLILFTILHHGSAGSNPGTILNLTMTWQGQTNTLLDSIIGTSMVALPIVTGGYSLCPIQVTNQKPLSGLSSPSALSCATAHTIVAAGFLLLLAIAIAQAAYSYWQLAQASSPVREEKKSSTTLYLARLALLSTAVLTLLEYVATPQPAMSPWSTSRYLVALPIVFPALLWPLWSGVGMIRWRGTAPLLRKGWLVLQYALLAFVLLLPFAGVVETLQAIPQTQAEINQQYAMIHDLERLGVKHFYTEYWTCDRVAFESLEQLTCSVLNNGLKPGQNRYLPYRDAVRSDPRAAYAFPDSDPAAIATLIQQAQHAKKPGRLLHLDGYMIYLPAH
jgi:hypothetical protein